MPFGARAWCPASSMIARISAKPRGRGVELSQRAVRRDDARDGRFLYAGPGRKDHVRDIAALDNAAQQPAPAENVVLADDVVRNSVGRETVRQRGGIFFSGNRNASFEICDILLYRFSSVKTTANLVTGRGTVESQRGDSHADKRTDRWNSRRARARMSPDGGLHAHRTGRLAAAVVRFSPRKNCTDARESVTPALSRALPTAETMAAAGHRARSKNPLLRLFTTARRAISSGRRSASQRSTAAKVPDNMDDLLTRSRRGAQKRQSHSRRPSARRGWWTRHPSSNCWVSSITTKGSRASKVLRAPSPPGHCTVVLHGRAVHRLRKPLWFVARR